MTALEDLLPRSGALGVPSVLPCAAVTGDMGSVSAPSVLQVPLPGIQSGGRSN